MDKQERIHLVLADGAAFPGEAFGARGVTVGQAVFTTTMTGYQEVLTDPSYAGLIAVMTAPEIGNVGVNASDAESVDGRPHVEGFVLREASPIASSWRAEQPLEPYLAAHGVVAIRGVDTRRLTRHLRDHGAQSAAIGPGPVEDLARRAREAASLGARDLVAGVTTRAPYAFTESSGAWEGKAPPPAARHVVALDLGAKKSQLRLLVDAGCKVTVVPATTGADELLALAPDGIFLSSGPGDPAAAPYAVETVRALLGNTPIFGVGLGHQILALALGAKTHALALGHRGANHPVKELATGRVEITTQSRGFTVDLASLPEGVEATHLHLNDGTCEGLAAKALRAFGLQYHPDAGAPFERFAASMAAG